MIITFFLFSYIFLYNRIKLKRFNATFVTICDHMLYSTHSDAVQVNPSDLFTSLNKWSSAACRYNIFPRVNVYNRRGSCSMYVIWEPIPASVLYIRNRFSWPIIILTATIIILTATIRAVQIEGRSVQLKWWSRSLKKKKLKDCKHPDKVGLADSHPSDHDRICANQIGPRWLDPMVESCRRWLDSAVQPDLITQTKLVATIVDGRIRATTTGSGCAPPPPD